MAELVQDHLGGYVTGGDEATWYPALWTWLVDKHDVRSVLDVGCGEGHSTRFFRDLGVEAVGVDGVEQDNTILTHDYTLGPYIPTRHFDLVWSCEFVEHVEERYVPNFLATFKHGNLVLMTHAFPGQQGHHHVNCQEPEYWIGAMAAIGHELDVELTTNAKMMAALNPNQYNHFARSGLAFRRYS